MYNFFSILGELVQYLSSYDLRKTHNYKFPKSPKADETVNLHLLWPAREV